MQRSRAQVTRNALNHGSTFILSILNRYLSMRMSSRIMSLVLLAAAFVWTAPAQAQNMPQQSPENPEAVEEAQSAVEEWLALTDAGSFGESWNEAASMLQDQVTEEEWVQQSEQINDQVGSVEERSLMREQYQENPENLPEGEYVFLIYEARASDFDQPLNEIVAATREDDSWKVAGYTMRPAQQQPQQQPPQQQPPNN